MPSLAPGLRLGPYEILSPLGEGVAEAAAPDHTVVFLQNFVDYLKQKVPLDK